MKPASKALSGGLIVLGLAVASAALAFPRDVTNVARPYINQAYAAPKQNDSEDAKVNDAVRLLIDTMFKERKIREAFEQSFLFSSLTPEEKGIIEPTSLYYSDEDAALEDKSVAGIFAAGWNYEYQPVLLALGTNPLSDIDEAVEQAEGEVKAERNRILSKLGLNESDFLTLLGRRAVKDRKTLENDLTTLEQINAKIDRFIEQRTNQTILTKNLAEMKKSISVKKVSTAQCTLYAVSLKPMFGVIFKPTNGELKMISFGDVR